MAKSIPTYRLYRERTEESGDFWIHCETIPERTVLHKWEIAPHRHESFFQIFALSHGEGELLGRAEIRRIRAPAALLVPAGATHGFRFSRDVDGLVLTGLADRLRSIADSDRAIAGFAAETRIVPLPADGGAVAECLRRIHAELRSAAAGRTILLEALMTQAVVALARAGAAPAANDAVSRDRLRLEQLETLIATHFREQLPVAFYAERIGVSAAHLNRLTRRLTGASVQGAIARRIVEAARRDLIFTPTPVQAIAFSLGFQDPAYFNRFFRKHAGVTPGAFREAERARLGGA